MYANSFNMCSSLFLKTIFGINNEGASYLGLRAAYCSLACFLFHYDLTNWEWNSLCWQSKIILYLGVN